MAEIGAPDGMGSGVMPGSKGSGGIRVVGLGVGMGLGGSKTEISGYRFEIEEVLIFISLKQPTNPRHRVRSVVNRKMQFCFPEYIQVLFRKDYQLHLEV